MAIYIQRRVIISVLLFFMFIVINLSNNILHISIVSMVDRNTSTSNLNSSINYKNIDQNKLNWDSFSIALVQGAFFWGYCITKIPGALLSQRYGSRKVLMISTFISAVTTCAFPIAAKIHPIFAFSLRVILGLANGITWPAAVALGALWIPACERSFFSNIFHGNNLANVIFYPICGYIMFHYGWESGFYLSGILCFVWLIFWYLYAYDSPNKHPTISYEEKAYLESNIIGITGDKNKKKQSLSIIPWKSMLTSSAFWATAIQNHGGLWCFTTLSLQLPRYFSDAHNVNIKTSGIVVGLPSIFRVLSGLIVGYYMDRLVKQNKCSITMVRKIAAMTSKVTTGFILLILASCTHKDYLISVILISIFYIFNGTTSSGGLANLSDIAPNFAGIITGLIHTTVFIPGILSPLIYGSILTSNPYNAWFWIFTILASTEIFSGVIFLIFGTGEVQSWNDVKKKTEDSTKLEEIGKLMEINKVNKVKE